MGFGPQDDDTAGITREPAASTRGTGGEEEAPAARNGGLSERAAEGPIGDRGARTAAVPSVPPEATTALSSGEAKVGATDGAFCTGYEVA